MKLLCLKNVVMEESGDVAFVKGKEYIAKNKHKMLDDPYNPELCIVANNEQHQEHVIKRPKTNGLSEFFNKHFQLVGKG